MTDTITNHYNTSTGVASAMALQTEPAADHAAKPAQPQGSAVYQAMLEQLATEKARWEITAFKTSNEMLYGLLQRCYGYYIAMCADTIEGKSAREGLSAYIKKHSLLFKSGTHNITKIVKCVFGVDRRRVSAYSIALRTAHEHKVGALNVVDFIIQQGGVEEIRLAKSTNAISTEQKAHKAAAAIKATSLAKIKIAEIVQKLDPSNVGKQVVLIATQGADGELTINAVVTSETATKAVLQAHYSANKTDINNAESAQAAAQPQQSVTDAVNAAAAKLAA